ncbi:MAG: glycosyltransferase family 2 protein [Lachnospiraceae bacterium]|nr:glycosyltransferase family 2 protein [Lachnospiraceae bacterium]
MRVTLLISSLNADTDKLIKKMRIAGDAVLVNQCDKNDRREIESGGRITIIDSDTRGVGVNRNLCIDNSFGDIVLFADDDIEYDDGYEEKIITEFEKHPEAEMIMFNFEVCDERRTYLNEGFKKLSKMNIGRYPAYSIAVKRDVLIKKNLRFSTLFGGGAKYSNGEDSLFLKEAMSKKVAMYSSDVFLGREIPRESTWFEGYTEKFFHDRGVLFAFLYGKSAWLWRLRFILVKKEMFKGKIGRKEADRLMKEGIAEGFELLKKDS